MEFDLDAVLQYAYRGIWVSVNINITRQFVASAPAFFTRANSCQAYCFGRPLQQRPTHFYLLQGSSYYLFLLGKYIPNMTNGEYPFI